MRMFRSLLLISGVAACGTLCAQATDTTVVQPTTAPVVMRPTATDSTDVDWRMRHRPMRATLYSAVLPGAGQIYNRKYWKAPIAWAGLGTCVYFIQDNNRGFQRYKTAYLASVDNDPTTEDEFQGRYQPDQLRQVANDYQRLRDLSYICFGLVYLLNVVDATVDGYFVRFDVGPELGLHIGPALPLLAQGGTGITLALRL